MNKIAVTELEQSGVKILKTYMCPHCPDGGCECRKAKPTMVPEAIKDFGLNPSETYMVGDHRSDVLVGTGAGLKTILVHTANAQD